MSFQDSLIFLKESIVKFKEIGALLPTSECAAEELAAPAKLPPHPKRILELGPGTGVVTIRILRNMGPNDELCVCEINPTFMQTLKERLNEIPEYHSRKDRVHFFLGAAQDLPETGTFDLIVCALPFLNFDLQTVKEIFDKLRRLSKPETLMTYYEFMGIRRISKLVSPKTRRERIRDIDGFFNIITKKRLSRRRIWLNLLPINVYRLKILAA